MSSSSTTLLQVRWLQLFVTACICSTAVLLLCTLLTLALHTTLIQHHIASQQLVEEASVLFHSVLPQHSFDRNSCQSVGNNLAQHVM